MSFYDEEDRAKGDAIPFRVGLVAAVVVIASSYFLMLILQHRTMADVITWLIEWMVLYFAARTAAQQRYGAQVDMVDPLQNLRGAGVGAALVTAILVGLFLTVRNLLDGGASSILLDLARITVDSFIALGLGAWGAQSVIKRNKTSETEFYNF